MIEFFYSTYRAEINAMPALPDVFRIIVPHQLIANERTPLRRPEFDGYECHEWKEPGHIELIYEKIREKKRTKKTSAQDLIIARFKGTT